MVSVQTGPFVVVALVMAAASPAAAQLVDPVARALARQALTDATATAITKTTIVGAESSTTPAANDPSGTIPSSPIQVNGSTPDQTGYMAFKFGDDAKGVTNYWVKTRGAAMNAFDAVMSGDRVVVDMWQAGTGAQTGHVGGAWVTIDGPTFSAGEVPGRWTLLTGTGIATSTASKEHPDRFGSLAAIVANSRQQVLFPGGVNPRFPAAGGDFGGWVVIGAGASDPGFGALKFLSGGASLLTTPEPGSFEVDGDATPYFTTGDGVRRTILLADVAAPSVRILPGAGAGASARIDATGPSGAVTLAVTAAATGGDLFAVTYAHRYPTASYPVVTAGNAAAAVLLQAGYVSATPVGFTLGLPPGARAPAGTYAFNFYAPGR